MHKAQSLVNHVVIVLDASASMRTRQAPVIKVTDEQIQHLAQRSKELNQETRVSVYRFGSTTIECLIFDMDVARLPSTKDLYQVLYEDTALIDATLKSQEDLATTSQLYGDHSFLTFVLTDGDENKSKRSASELARFLKNMPENWSIGFLVPDNKGVEYLQRLGVLRDSIAIWDTTKSEGIGMASSAIRDATDFYMTRRAQGIRGTRGVFSTGTDAVNKKTVKTNLVPLQAWQYKLLTVNQAKVRVDDFVNNSGRTYILGKAYYQLCKKETIQPQKQIIIVDKKTGAAYAGDTARDVIGLPGMNVSVRPDYNPDYDIFVQSTSYNRNLFAGSKLLLLT